ncbi:MAG: hypothetical protein V1244_06020 [Nitrospinaceae bacterium]|jgi:hypothetical protein|nr:hypothetical protein [Nitrospinaceae bacterium]|tara:strand:- start:697 stop:1080 length:384 start_codon:yes stop_codon:yes gene_type:complete
MARGIGIALRGAGKALGKQLKKAPALGKYAKAGAARGMRGQTVAEKYKKALGPIPKGVKAPKIPSIKKTTRDIGKGAIIAGVAYAAGKAKATKEAEAKADKKELEEATKKHEKKTKEKREKYGKHHG